MVGHVQQAVRRKISDFIHLEDGRIGTHKAITTAAIVTSSALAGILLTPQPALAGHCDCPSVPTCGQLGYICCWYWDNSCRPDPLSQGYAYSCDSNGGFCD